MTPSLQQLRFADLYVFLTVRRCGTVSGAARELGTTPSQVSRTIARLETQLGKKLLVRRADGVAVSDEGQRSMPDLEEIVARVRRLGRIPSGARELTVAATPPASELFLPLLAEPDLRLRALELPAAAIRAWASRSLYDAALLEADRGSLPPSWVARPVGHIRFGLYAARPLAERLARSADELLVPELPFVQLVSCFGGETIELEDGGPLPVGARRVIHQAGTYALCCAIAARSESVVHAPAPAARPFVEGGALVPVAAPGWDRDHPLLLACNQDRVTVRQQHRLEAILSARLDYHAAPWGADVSRENVAS